MRIVIIGAGTVGSAICEQLAGEGHEITVVDKDESIVSDLVNVCDVGGIVGNGADVSVLRKASAGSADLLIAVASNDEVNILACAAAKKIGTKHTVARVRNPEYTELMDLMKDDMSLSLTINPEYAAAKDVYRLLRFPSAAKIDTFFHGRIELAEFAVAEGSPLCDRPLNELRAKWNIGFLVCAVLRGGAITVPSGRFTLCAGDTVCVTAPREALPRFFRAIGAYRRPIRDVMIAGAGRTTYYLEALLREGKIGSTVIDKDRERCDRIAGAYGCTVICGNPSKQDLLLEEGLEKTDAFLAFSGVDEENAIMSMFAKTKGVEKVLTMIGGMPYVDFFKRMGLDGIVSPKTSTATEILRFIRSMANTRGSEIRSLHRFMDNRVEALEFVIKEPIPDLTDLPLREMKLRAGILLACIGRGDDVVLPSGDTDIRVGDTVVVTAAFGQVNEIRDILR